jgi:hypothetical protein
MAPCQADSLLTCIAITTIAMSIAGCAATAQENRFVAAVDKPVTVPLVQASSADAERGSPVHVVVTVTGFRPSPAGPVQAVIDVQCDGSKVEIGRFGILPQTPFSASEPSKAQRFSLTLSPHPPCTQPESVTIRVVPTHGDGRGAMLEIGGAELR